MWSYVRVSYRMRSRVTDRGMRSPVGIKIPHLRKREHKPIKIEKENNSERKLLHFQHGDINSTENLRDYTLNWL